MRVLLDNMLDPRFRRLLVGHEVFHCRFLGWETLRNGDLVTAAEESGFEVLVTGDKSIRYQQNLAHRRISIVTLGSHFMDFPTIKPLASEVLAALQDLPEGSFVTVGGEDGQ